MTEAPGPRNLNQAMKILFLSKSWPVIGGVETWLRDMTVGLRKRGLEVEVWVAGGGERQSGREYIAAYPEIRAKIITPRNLFPSYKWRAIKHVLECSKPDVVIPVMLADALYQSAYLKERLGFRLLYPVHEHGRGPIADIINYGSIMDSVLCVDLITYDTARAVSPASRVLHVPCGVSWPCSSEPVVRAPDGVPVIGFCGRLEEEAKRATDIVDFYQELAYTKKRFKLLIAGEGFAQRKIESKLAFNKLVEVTFLGRLSTDQIEREFYNKIDYLLITSECETGPLVAFEAMARNRLVVTSDFSGRAYNRELEDKKNCLVYPVGNMQEATRCILHLESDPCLRESLRKKGYAHFVRARTPDLMFDSWVNEISRSLESAPHCAKNKLRPPLAENGSLAGLGLSQTAADSIRTVLGKTVNTTYASEEWPYYSQVTDEY